MVMPGSARSEETPVLVAGGGPAGLAAAAELASRGVPCVVVEPRAQVSHRRPRAKTTSVRTMEHLRRWGIADALRAAAPLPVAWSQRVTFCESLSGRRVTDFEGAFGLVTGRDERFAEAGQQVPQPVVEEVLRAHVRAQPGVDLRLGHTVTGLAQRHGGVTVAVRDAAGSGYEITARYLIGCDGATGVARDQIGARYVGYSDPRPNFNVVFRAPSLDTDLGPAVQYWVLGAPVPGLLGRLDLHGTWWGILPGIEAGYGAAHAADLINGLVGRPVEHEVLACDPYIPPSAFFEAGVESVSLDDLLRRSHAVSIHVPLTSRTRHLIGARELGLMQPTSVLVNTSRGAVVDQTALAEALQTRVIEGAACDVWEREPAELSHPLFSCDNFIGSPHVAGLSVEGQIDNRTKQAQEVVRVLTGHPPLNPVSPEE